jgi:hypothetical protein
VVFIAHSLLSSAAELAAAGFLVKRFLSDDECNKTLVMRSSTVISNGLALYDLCTFTIFHLMEGVAQKC